MSERGALAVFKGIGEGAFRESFERAVNAIGGRVLWNVGLESVPMVGMDCRMSHNGDVHAVSTGLPGGEEYKLFSAIGAEHDIPWIYLHVQDGSFWDYVLYRGTQEMDRFSPDPLYWDDDSAEAAKWRGQAGVLASVWGLSVDRVERYLQDWMRTEIDEDIFEYGRKGKAYVQDRFEYGNIWQVMDFLSVLGGLDPSNLMKDGKHHRVIV